MTVEKLDLIFPYVIFAYGAIMTFTLNSPLAEMAESRLPLTVSSQMKAHRGLALFCLIAGGLWSLQNLWL